MSSSTRRWGLMVGPDGTMHTSICRAKKPGTGRCHHFAHVRNAETAQSYIALHQLQPDLMKVVNYDRDVTSLNGSIRDYLDERGIKIEYDPSDKTHDKNAHASILESWFHGDRKLAKRVLGDAQESGVIPKIRVADSVRTDVSKLVSDGVGVRVEGNRFSGMSPESDVKLDSDVWMVANGINEEYVVNNDDENVEDAPVMIMVAEGTGESSAISNVRSGWTSENHYAVPVGAHEETDADDAPSIEDIGYASLHGKTVSEI